MRITNFLLIILILTLCISCGRQKSMVELTHEETRENAAKTAARNAADPVWREREKKYLEFVEQAKQPPSITPEKAQVIIEDRSNQVAAALTHDDIIALDAMIHPQKGMWIILDNYRYSYTHPDVHLNSGKLSIQYNEPDEVKWGGVYNNPEEPIMMTTKDFFAKYYFRDFKTVTQVGYNEIIVNLEYNKGREPESLFYDMPKAIMVEYYFEPLKTAVFEFDWKMVRFFFEEYNGQWYLIGLMYDEFRM